ncbi:MAG: type 1 glutamine amidotransferase [Paludibacter sp.]
MKNKLSIQVFQHVAFEGLGCIEKWITANKHSVTYTHFYKTYQLPTIEQTDWLIVMGGPMGVYDEAVYPFLKDEKEFIRLAIENGKTVLGICLGSQLIAEVLGAKVYPNKQKEIGWMNVKLTNEARSLQVFTGFEDEFAVFQWHGDTYELPNESTLLFSSAVCQHQAFLFKNKILGLQFHFEVTPESLREMVENGMHELVESETVQSAEKILEQTNYFESNNKKMFQLLDYLVTPNP